MAQFYLPKYQCEDCVGVKSYGTYNCKKCSQFYTSEFRTKSLSYKQEKRLARKNSPEELKKAYDWLRENIFPKGYVLPSSCVTFRYRRGYGGSCSQSNKTIKIGSALQGNSLYQTMLHEMLHLRLPHHRKGFKEKEKELKKILEQKRVLIPNSSELIVKDASGLDLKSESI